MVGVVTIVLGGAILATVLRADCLRVPPRPQLPRALALRRGELAARSALRTVEALALVLVATPKAERRWQRFAAPFVPLLRQLAWPFGLRASEWVALSAVAGGAAAAVLWLVGAGPVVTTTAVLSCGAAPYLWLRSQWRTIEDRIVCEFSDVLDAWSLLLEAGLDLPSAMEHVVTHSPPSPLIRHVRALVADMHAGARLADAIEQLRTALNIEVLNGFFAAVAEAVQGGAVLTPTLRVQSDILRQRRFELAERRAAEAAVRMLIPLLLIFAAVLAVIVGPLVAQLSVM